MRRWKDAAQSGNQLDVVPILRRIYTDGMGFRGFDQVVKPAPMAPPGMPPGAPPPPQGGPPPAQDGGRVRSAMEQAGGAQGDMVPGEGGAFSEVRAGADQMAADIGSQLEV